jgi:hypothetical protein
METGSLLEHKFNTSSRKNKIYFYFYYYSRIEKENLEVVSDIVSFASLLRIIISVSQHLEKQKRKNKPLFYL